jgi:hypothetical protein
VPGEGRRKHKLLRKEKNALRKKCKTQTPPKTRRRKSRNAEAYAGATLRLFKGVNGKSITPTRKYLEGIGFRGGLSKPVSKMTPTRRKYALLVRCKYILDRCQYPGWLPLQMPNWRGLAKGLRVAARAMNHLAKFLGQTAVVLKYLQDDQRQFSVAHDAREWQDWRPAIRAFRLGYRIVRVHGPKCAIPCTLSVTHICSSRKTKHISV